MKPSETNDYYERLGIGRGVSQDKIQGAYRRLAMKYHPDRNPGNKDAETQFKAVSEAYSTLYDSRKRAQYDAVFETKKKESETNINDVFKAFHEILKEGLKDFKEGYRLASKPNKKTIDIYV